MHAAAARLNPLTNGFRLALWYTTVILTVAAAAFTMGYLELNLVAGTFTALSVAFTAATSPWTWPVVFVGFVALKIQLRSKS